jgi:hypothetical protein
MDSKKTIRGIWNGMINRCYSERNISYSNYGGRGIKVCGLWKNSFEEFYKDMGPRPSPKHSLDRINTYGNYEPGNCRWATSLEQGENRRTNVMITHDGKTQSLTKWARDYGVPELVAYQRYIHKKPFDHIFSKINHTTKKPMIQKISNKKTIVFRISNDIYDQLKLILESKNKTTSEFVIACCRDFVLFNSQKKDRKMFKCSECNKITQGIPFTIKLSKDSSIYCCSKECVKTAKRNLR